jgi:hypothetical protein
MIFAALSITLSSCYMTTPDPLASNLGARWDWQETKNNNGVVLDKKSNTHTKMLAYIPPQANEDFF